MAPLAIELFAGKFGWGEAFAAEGWQVVGFDIEHLPHHGPVPPGCELVLQDVQTLHGSQLRNADAILASPPCQGYSARAMPWARLRDEMLIQHSTWEDEGGSPFERPLSNPPIDNTLFRATLRIHREACEAAGRYIPLLIENVKGAQRWIGSARWHYGSFYLWGDIPALMPMSKLFKTAGHANKRRISTNRDAAKNATTVGGTWFGVTHGKRVQSNAGNPVRGNNEFATAEAGRKVPGIKLSEVGFNVAAAQRYRQENGTKQEGSGAEWLDNGLCQKSSRSDSRKAASAQIAKIPEPLARHIARIFKP